MAQHLQYGHIFHQIMEFVSNYSDKIMAKNPKHFLGTTLISIEPHYTLKVRLSLDEIEEMINMKITLQYKKIAVKVASMNSPLAILQHLKKADAAAAFHNFLTKFLPDLLDEIEKYKLLVEEGWPLEVKTEVTPTHTTDIANLSFDKIKEMINKSPKFKFDPLEFKKPYPFGTTLTPKKVTGAEMKFHVEPNDVSGWVVPSSSELDKVYKQATESAAAAAQQMKAFAESEAFHGMKDKVKHLEKVAFKHAFAETPELMPEPEPEPEKEIEPMEPNKPYKGKTMFVEAAPTPNEKIPILQFADKFKAVDEKFQDVAGQILFAQAFSESFAYRLRTNPDITEVKVPETPAKPIYICSSCSEIIPEDKGKHLVRRCPKCKCSDKSGLVMRIESVSSGDDKYLLYDKALQVKITIKPHTGYSSTLSLEMNTLVIHANIETIIRALFGAELPPLKNVNIGSYKPKKTMGGFGQSELEIEWDVKDCDSLFQIIFVYGHHIQ